MEHFVISLKFEAIQEIKRNLSREDKDWSDQMEQH